MGVFDCQSGKSRLNPPFMIFDEMAVSYQLRGTSNLHLPKVTAIYYGTDPVRFMGQRAWAGLPTELKVPAL